MYAVKHSVCFNYQFGFDVSIPAQSVFDQYSLPRQHTVRLHNGTTFLYSRNFQLFTGGFNFLHQKLGYLHDTEIASVQQKDAEMSEATNSPTNTPSRNLFGGTASTPFTTGDASLIDTTS